MKLIRTKHFLLASLLLAGFSFTGCKKAVMKGGVDFNSISVQESKVIKTFETAKQNDKNVLVFFDAAWCGSCRKLNQFTMKDAKIRKTLADYELINVDVDKFPDVPKG